MKRCKAGYYYCYTDKKCKSIPKGFKVVGPAGYLRKENGHSVDDESETETKKNGNGNGENGGDGGAVSEGWSEKYKRSIDCNNPKGFSQKAHCQGRKKVNEAKEKGDHEVSMAKTQVKKSIDNLQKVARVLAKKTDADNLPAWVQSKLTNAEHDTDAAASYMDEGKRDGKSAKDKDYSLRDWFKGGGWVQAGGKYDGKPCAKQPGQKTKPFCRDADDRAAMSKDEREKRAKKKRREDPNPNRKGKAKMVREAVDATKHGGPERLLQKLVDEKKRRGEPDGGGLVIPLQKAHYEPEGEVVSEKKDACYRKVKARYDVWPSAYASGALVKCRKVGAANWGNKTKKEEYEYSNWREESLQEGLPLAALARLVIPNLVRGGARGAVSALPYLVAPETMKTIALAKGIGGVGNAIGGLANLAAEKKKKKREEEEEEENGVTEAKNDPCWVGYKQVGMKKKGGKMVPNCVKEGYSNWREELSEDWQKVNKKDKTDGMSQKAVDAYRRENPGSKLKTAVTEKKPKGKRAKRRKSFCARSDGQRKMHNIDCKKTPDKAICKARRRWRC